MKLKHIPINRAPDEQTTSESLAGRMRRMLDRVRDRAYELFDRRGREHGRDLEDWFQAEYECGLCRLPLSTRPKPKSAFVSRVLNSARTSSRYTWNPSYQRGGRCRPRGRVL